MSCSANSDRPRKIESCIRAANTVLTQFDRATIFVKSFGALCSFTYVQKERKKEGLTSVSPSRDDVGDALSTQKETTYASHADNPNRDPEELGSQTAAFSRRQSIFPLLKLLSYCRRVVSEIQQFKIYVNSCFVWSHSMSLNPSV